MIRRLTSIPLLIGLFAIFFFALQDYQVLYNDAARVYFQLYGYVETGSLNLVTAIYLDYRLLDTLFEAGILLTLETVRYRILIFLKINLSIKKRVRK